MSMNLPLFIRSLLPLFSVRVLSSYLPLCLLHLFFQKFDIMKYSTALLGALALSVTKVTAFPTAMFDMMERAENSMSLDEIAAAIAAAKDKRQILPPGFDAASQYISNQGNHKFVPPNFAAGDQRGPCPGMSCIFNDKSYIA
jgi:hypothetical protein